MCVYIEIYTERGPSYQSFLKFKPLSQLCLILRVQLLDNYKNRIQAVSPGRCEDNSAQLSIISDEAKLHYLTFTRE